MLSIFGHSLGFARELLAIEVGAAADRIHVDAQAREAGYQRGAFFCVSSKNCRSISYEMRKLESEATLLVFPGGGGEINCDLDLSTIP